MAIEIVRSILWCPDAPTSPWSLKAYGLVRPQTPLYEGPTAPYEGHERLGDSIFIPLFTWALPGADVSPAWQHRSGHRARFGVRAAVDSG